MGRREEIRARLSGDTVEKGSELLLLRLTPALAVPFENGRNPMVANVEQLKNQTVVQTVGHGAGDAVTDGNGGENATGRRTDACNDDKWSLYSPVWFEDTL